LLVIPSTKTYNHSVLSFQCIFGVDKLEKYILDLSSQQRLERSIFRFIVFTPSVKIKMTFTFSITSFRKERKIKKEQGKRERGREGRKRLLFDGNLLTIVCTL